MNLDPLVGFKNFIRRFLYLVSIYKLTNFISELVLLDREFQKPMRPFITLDK